MAAQPWVNLGAALDFFSLDAGDNVQKHLAITERGRSYLRHRDTAIDF
jgi:hypothetical protein